MNEVDAAEVAGRCLEDVAYAREILAGTAHPSVRGALVDDLEAALTDAQHRMLNPQPLPPEPPPDNIWVMTERIWASWQHLERASLRSVAEARSSD